jgi:hypothetical protein
METSASLACAAGKGGIGEVLDCIRATERAALVCPAIADCARKASSEFRANGAPFVGGFA